MNKPRWRHIPLLGWWLERIWMHGYTTGLRDAYAELRCRR